MSTRPRSAATRASPTSCCSKRAWPTRCSASSPRTDRTPRPGHRRDPPRSRASRRIPARRAGGIGKDGPMVRVRAPELRGRGWLNTGGQPLRLAELRGKIVLLDFWTFCCINCLHVLDELRPLEERYGDVLVIIGVHSPKFEHEKDPEALAAAVERYEVRHPVLDDPELDMWQQYTAKAWPTLVVIDPE